MKEGGERIHVERSASEFKTRALLVQTQRPLKTSGQVKSIERVRLYYEGLSVRFLKPGAGVRRRAWQ